MNRVLVCAPVAPPLGGIATWSEELKSLRLDSEDLRVDFLPTNIPGRRAKKYGALDRILSGFLFAVPFLVRYVASLVFHRPNTVHVCSSGGYAHLRDFVLLGIARVLGARVVLHLHFGCIDSGYKWVRGGRQLLKIASSFADKILVLDKRMTSLFPSGKAVVVGNYLAPRMVEDEANFKQNTILYVGWIIPEKGVNDLLDSWGKVNLTHNWQLDLIGPVDEHNLAILTSRLPYLRGVRYLGSMSRTEVLQRIAAARVLALPSQTEGLPFVLIEAMKYRCALLARNVGGIAQIFERSPDTPPGILLSEGECLTAALERIIADNELSNGFAENALHIFDRFYTHNSFIAELREVWSY